MGIEWKRGAGRRLGMLALMAGLWLAASAAHAEKVLHIYQGTGESAIDPASASDIATLGLIENLFDPLLRYDYLARPVRLRGNTASALPTVSQDGRVYTFQLRRQVFFTPDPAFGGKLRELTAADYVYSLKRLYDPRIKSPWLSFFEGKIEGDQVLRQAGAGFDYEREVSGLRALDRYTLQIRLNAPDHNLPYYLATPASSAVAREVVERYGAQVGNHPVGTGPFRMGAWKRSDRIELLAQRQAHTQFETVGSPDLHDQALAAALKGKRLPLVDRIDIKVAEEFQGRMLGFLNGQYDYIEQVPESMTSMVIARGDLKPELKAKGMVLSRFPVPQTYYMWMNMDDPVIGGSEPAKLALRRAIAMSYDRAKDVALLKQGFALGAESLLPPGIELYEASYRSGIPHDRSLANALLDRFGYTQRDPDGMRRDPNGRELTLTMHSEATASGRLRDEFWRRGLMSIGVRVRFVSDKKSEIIKASRQGRVQMFESNWIADYPDGENFYQLLYGPNVGRANYSRFKYDAYDRLFEQFKLSTDREQRSRLMQEMNQIIEAYNPIVPLTHPVSADIRHAWLNNYHRHPVEFTAWRYLDIAR